MKQVNIKKVIIASIFLHMMGLFTTINAATPTKVDIIFVMDTSGSMNNEATALKNAITTVTQDLSTVYDLDIKSWGITETKSSWGLTSNIRAEISQATSDQLEDWGPATYDIATYYAGWRADTIKIVVPISDEGPEDGGGYKSYITTSGEDALNQDDTDSINDARNAVDATNINVIPVISEGNHQDLILKDYAKILSDKAIKTGTGDLAEQFKTIIADIVADASGASLGSVTADYYESFYTGGKLVINAKGASAYNVVVKFDDTEILNISTNESNIQISYPAHDMSVSHILEIDYTVYATDATGQILEEKSKTLTHNTLSISDMTLLFPERKTAITPEGKIDASSKSTSLVSDPVDISSGNFIFSNNDLIVPTAGTPLVIKRFYNSLEPIRGWRFSIDSEMDISDIDNIKVSWQGGDSRDTFVKAKEGWVAIYSADTLTTEAGFYVVTKSNGSQYKFDTSGKLIQITNKQNLGLVFERSGSSTTVKDNFSNLLATITRNSSSQIISITDANGNAMSYTYSGSNLSSYTNRNGDTETYEYSGDLIERIIGADTQAYVSNTYDTQGRVVSQLDGAGNQTSFAYTGDLPNFVVDSANVTYPDGITRTHNFNLLLPTSIEGSGTTLSFEYDANNIVKAITDTNGKTWSYERNAAGQVTKSTDPQGNTTLKAYDASGNIISSTNALGRTVTFEYDTSNNLVKSTNAEGKITAYAYNANNQIVKITNALSQETVYAYNAQARLETITRVNGAIITYTYNALGNVKTVTDALGRAVNYDYDKEGKVTVITNPMSYQTKMEYNAFGDLIKVTDAKNRSINMEYNIDGLLTKTTLVDGTTIESTYDVLGRVISTKDVLGRESKKEYDDFGRVSKVIDPKGNEFLLDYDAIGNLIKVTDAKGNDAQTQYDELYRPSKTIDADGVEVATTTYNALSMPSKVEDTLGKSIEFSFDSLNRLQSSTLSGSIRAEALYDALGRISEITDPKGAKNSYEYNAIGKLVKETNPLNKENTYAYDVLGRVTSSTTPNGVVTSYIYDDLDRLTKLTQVKGADTTETTYTYDEVGNALAVTDEQGTITYTYNINDQVATRTDIFGNTVIYAYDQAKRLASISYPDGKKITYAYDDNNNLTKVTDFANRETLFEYDVNGNLLKTTHVNGAYTLYTYDNNSRLLTLRNFNNKDVLISSNELSRNSIGDITDNQETSPATVDLTKIKNFNFTVNDFNQVTSSDEGNFSYDDNGNLLSYTINGKAITLDYDLSDALTNASIGADAFSYNYDAEGNRVAVNGKRYLIDNVMGLSKPLAEMDASNAISKYYIWANGLAYSVDSAGEVLVYLYDYQGNTNAVLDMANKEKASYRYSAYGSLMSADMSLDNPFRYLGQHGIISDSDSLYYVRARYYSTELNRWTQADIKRGGIASPLSLNRYVWNEGDGVNFIDVNGLFSVESTVDNVVNYKINGVQLKYWAKSSLKTGQFVLEAETKIIEGFGKNVIYEPAVKTIKDYKTSVRENEGIVGHIDGIARGTVTVASAGLSSVNPFTYIKSSVNTGIDSGVADSSKAKIYKDNFNMTVDTIDLVHGVYQVTKSINTINKLKGQVHTSKSTLSRLINGKTFYSIPQHKQKVLLKLLKNESLFKAGQAEQVRKLISQNSFESLNQLNGIVLYLTQYGEKLSSKSSK